MDLPCISTSYTHLSLDTKSLQVKLIINLYKYINIIIGIFIIIGIVKIYIF